MFDVVALGELLIDFTGSGKSGQNNFLYEANPGGAPCNVLSLLSKYNKKTAFIGKVGNDAFGHLLKKTLEDVNIETKGLKVANDVNTTLAFIQTDAHGERSFSFFRNPGADMKLVADEVNFDLIKRTKVFHFGTLSMTHDEVRVATKEAIQCAKDNGALISFDPNLRQLLWSDLELAKQQMLYGCSKCDILKIEDDELKFMTGLEGIDEGVSYLKDHFNIQLILVTSGPKGSHAYYKDIHVQKDAFLTRKTIDTTGAGDTFMGMCLRFVLNHGMMGLNESLLEQMLIEANAAASIVTTRKGAIRSMPTEKEVSDWIKSYQH